MTSLYLLLFCGHWTTSTNPQVMAGILIPCDLCPAEPNGLQPERQVWRVTVRRPWPVTE